MKTHLRGFSGITLALFWLFSVPAFAGGEKESFEALVKAFNAGDYYSARSLSRDLKDSKRYGLPTRLIISDIYFQESDVYAAEQELESLLRDFPNRADKINPRLEKVRKEKTFLSESGRDQNRRFRVHWSAKSTDEKILAIVNDASDRAYIDGGKFFETYPDDQIHILVYSGKEYSEYTDFPLWSGAGYDGKIRIKTNKNMTRERLSELIYHEYAHLLMHRLVRRGNTPLWFNEAAAQYFAHKFNMSGELGRLPAPTVKPHQFPANWSDKSEEVISQFYRESLSVLVYLVGRTSERVVIDVLNGLADGLDFTAALNRAISMYGYNYLMLFDY